MIYLKYKIKIKTFVKFMFKNTLLFIFELTKIIIISLIIIIPIRYFLIQPFYVKGASMEPNFHDHEYLIVDEISYRFNKPRRGDIVVFRYPRNPQEYFIKRLIGLPGETIEIKDESVIIFNKDYPDGIKLKETYLEPNIKTYGFNKEKVILGEKEFFFLGDNRTASKDSRTFGPVNKDLIIGKVLLRGWPFNKLKLFKIQEYNY